MSSPATPSLSAPAIPRPSRAAGSSSTSGPCWTEHRSERQGETVMANFSVGTKVSTTEDSVSVDVTPAAAIPPGVHHFQLIVVDDAGNESDPATAQVVVRD